MQWNDFYRNLGDGHLSYPMKKKKLEKVASTVDLM